MTINRFFVLGGDDGEMRRIKEVLDTGGIQWIQPQNFWGPKKLTMEEVAPAMTPGYQVVFVEVTPPDDFPRVRSMVVIDHHGDNAGLPASILQVLNLLHIEPARRDELIAANDSGWFPGLIAAGATREEMDEIRVYCRAAHGSGSEHEAIEAEALRALAAPVEAIGDIRVIRMSHSKCAPVGDRLAIAAIAEGKPVPQYLVLSGDGETNFSGDGAVAKALFDHFREPHPAKGNAGGSGLGRAGETAYFVGYPDQKEVVVFIRQYLGL